jgi:hypothetical protein
MHGMIDVQRLQTGRGLATGKKPLAQVKEDERVHAAAESDYPASGTRMLLQQAFEGFVRAHGAQRLP